MSTALVEPVIERPIVDRPETLRLVAVGPLVTPEEEFADPHPLLPVFVIGALAFMLAAAAIGSIVASLLLRNSGVMAQ